MKVPDDAIGAAGAWPRSRCAITSDAHGYAVVCVARSAWSASWSPSGLGQGFAAAARPARVSEVALGAKTHDGGHPAPDRDRVGSPRGRGVGHPAGSPSCRR
eukprot:4003071-Pyramimonas_sp.AAC.1